ncbi:AraC family transcriptional regulator [Actinocorallia sp. B10E7]|uniref:AraC family transcriptional regulator n=1 Tax=Actinocorallia sp. B10E7 TaxID=3153558 RepID=UPI00325EF89A
MDPFDDLLRGVRADGAVFGRSVLSPPWALRFTDGASLTLCVPMRGEGWILLEGSEKTWPVRTGEAAIVCGPEPFVFSDRPLTDHPPDRVREVCCGRVGHAEPANANLADGTVLLAGAYHVRGEVPRRLVQVLPPVLVVPDEHDCTSMRDYLEAQLSLERPGRQVVLDRLLDWLLVCTLRDWFDRPDTVSPPWYRALADDVVGPALRALHEEPERRWTLAALAREAGVSRTRLATRFTEVMGEPPLAYLTGWRMALAADLLAESTTTVAAVARRVGYADAFGFSTAFKRLHGTNPSDYRRSVRAEKERAARALSP